MKMNLKTVFAFPLLAMFAAGCSNEDTPGPPPGRIHVYRGC